MRTRLQVLALWGTFGFMAVGSTPAAVVPADDGGSDWPWFRGPDHNGISEETGWSVAGKSAPLWETNVGLGYSGLSVADGRLYTMGYDEEQGLDTVFCLDAQTGEQIWSHSYSCEIWATAHRGGTLNTPTVDGDVVYTTNREGKFFCFKVDDGDVVWERDLHKEKRLGYPTWGFSAAPVIRGDRLILNLGRIYALDRKSGREIWKSSDFGHAYSTPVAAELDGKDSIVVFNGDGLGVVDEHDGSRMYFHEWTNQPHVNAASPILIGNRVFISSGYNRGCAMLELSEGNSRVVWESKAMRNQMNACTFYEGHLYGFDEAVLKCVDPDGKEQWRKRGMGKGTHIIAGGRLILLTTRGELVIADATPERFAQLSRKRVLRGGEYFTTPVLSHGLIYCRNSLGDVVCVDHRE